MNAFERQLIEAAEAVKLMGDGTFAWAGGQVDAARRVPVERLTDWLYDCFYSPGTILPGPLVPGRLLNGPTPLAESMSRANASRWSEQAGWTIRSMESEHVVLERRRLVVWADRAAIAPATAQAGATCAVRFPKESFFSSPGYYVCHGERALGVEAGPPARIYWNVDWRWAPLLVSVVTTALNRRQVPFSLKAPNHPSGYRRADPAVLYIALHDQGRVTPIIEYVRETAAAGLRDPVPALTARIGRGVSYAHDPGVGDSFGRHRCRLIACGLVSQAAQSGTVRARLSAIAEVFQRHGLDARIPYHGIPR